MIQFEPIRPLHTSADIGSVLVGIALVTNLFSEFYIAPRDEIAARFAVELIKLQPEWFAAYSVDELARVILLVGDQIDLNEVLRTTEPVRQTSDYQSFDYMY